MDHFAYAFTCTIIVRKRQKVTSVIGGHDAFINRAHRLYIVMEGQRSLLRFYMPPSYIHLKRKLMRYYDYDRSWTQL